MNVRLKKCSESLLIFDDIRIVLSSKPVITILAISAFVRMLFYFLILPYGPSEFGPDEATYSSLAKYVSQGLPVNVFPVFGSDLYESAKSLVLPSALLIQLGTGELNAVRLVSSTYGLASSLVLALCFLSFMQWRSQNFQEMNSLFDRKFLALFSVFTFFPSNFLWSIIGLRESASQFWLITSFYLILKLLNSAKKDVWKLIALFAIALTLAHGARPETALVFSLAVLLFSVVIILKFRNFFPLIATFIGVFTGQAFTASSQILTEESFILSEVILPTINDVETNTDVISSHFVNDELDKALCARDNLIIVVDGREYLCKFKQNVQEIKPSALEQLGSMVMSVRSFETRRNVNALDSKSNLPISNCQSSSTEILILIKCNLLELPDRLFAFLFRPLILFDQGTPTLTFAALENLGWVILISLSILVSLRRRENNVDRLTNLGLISYVLLFASSAALYEGNLGTAFRHKSTILWPIIFILMITPSFLPKLRRKIDSAS